MEYPHETFPEYKTLFNSMRIGNCDVTKHIVAQELNKIFKPITLTGLRSFPESKFKSKVMKHLAKRYDFFPRIFQITLEYQASSYEFDLGDGIRLLARCMNPETLGEDPTEEYFYLTLLYLKKGEFKNKANPLKRVLEFVKWLEKMNECPVKVVYFRPFSITEQKHFQLLEMVERPNATTERLRNAYQRVWNAKEMKIRDVEGEFYFEIPFRSVSYVA